MNYPPGTILVDNMGVHIIVGSSPLRYIFKDLINYKYPRLDRTYSRDSRSIDDYYNKHNSSVKVLPPSKLSKAYYKWED